MTELVFRPATKEQAKARIALCGPPGSGKTYTALTLATTLADGGTIGVIDTERGSAAKYAHLFKFEHLPLNSFSPEILPKALAVAAAEGFAVVCIDGLSHFWMGTDGMLQYVDNATKRAGGGSSFNSGWKEARPVENAMVDAMLSYPGHLIACMRTKTEYIVEDIGGKKVPRKIGMAPVQRDGIEYEFDVVGDLDQENNLTITKTRIDELAGKVIRKPGEDMAREVLGWLNMGAEVADASDLLLDAMSPEATADKLLALHARAKRANLLGAALVDPETGHDSNLGAIIVRRGYQVRDAERKAAAEPSPAREALEAHADELATEPGPRRGTKKTPAAQS